MSATPVAIGDVQGCCDSLQALIARVDRDAPDAPLWFCGDLVNRGPKSLQTLRFVRALGARAVVVLGNHDLHLLVHAGVLPQWSATRAVQLSGEVSARLGGPDARTFLATMYGNEPARWDDALPGADRWRVVVNALTRLRFCTPSGLMEFATKDVADAAPAGYLPWFDTRRASADVTVVFGHWSHLGLVMRPNLLALDTGCVWGNRLTAVSLEADPAGRRVWQVQAQPKIRAYYEEILSDFSINDMSHTLHYLLKMLENMQRVDAQWVRAEGGPDTRDGS